ncbi:MAG: four helix bundle protein [Thermoplasmata archaeon]
MKTETDIQDYRDLDVWKLSHAFVIEIYKITLTYPKDEMYGLTSQIRRAAYSVPANIAEGNGRQHLKEYIQFLYISKASLNETTYCLLLSKDMGYIGQEKCNDLIERTDRIGMLIMGLIRSLKCKISS